MKMIRIQNLRCVFLARLLCSLLCAGLCQARTEACAQQPTAAEAQESQELTGQQDSASDRRPFATQAAPEVLKPLLPESDATRWLHRNRLRLYGWTEGGYSYTNAGDGLLAIAPTPNRFSNEFLLNGAWLILDRSTTKKPWSWGFRTDFYAGSDAALLRPLNSFGPQGNHLGTDFRQAYFSLHTPGLNKRGIDWNLGRQNAPIGFDTLMAPYRPMYSLGYFWIKYEVGSTAALATIHPTEKLDMVLGTFMGYNTVFVLRGRAPVYVARALYRPFLNKDTQLIATVFSGPQPAGTTAGHLGSWQTVSELEARRRWTPRLGQLFQVHYAADVRDPATQRVSPTQGAFVLTAIRLNPKLFLNLRQEWFSDPHGIRNITPGTYSEADIGVNVQPVPWLNFRPGLRGDFAGQRSFTSSLGGAPRRNQLTVAFDLVVKFSVFH